MLLQGHHISHMWLAPIGLAWRVVPAGSLNKETALRTFEIHLISPQDRLLLMPGHTAFLSGMLPVLELT